MYIPSEIIIHIASFMHIDILRRFIIYRNGTAIFYRALCDSRYSMNRIIPYEHSLAHMSFTSNQFIVEVKLRTIMDLISESHRNDTVCVSHIKKYIIKIHKCNIRTPPVCNPQYCRIVKNSMSVDYNNSTVLYESVIPSSSRVPVTSYEFNCKSTDEYNKRIVAYPKWFSQINIILRDVNDITIAHHDIKKLVMFNCKNINVTHPIDFITVCNCRQVKINNVSNVKIRQSKNVTIDNAKMTDIFDNYENVTINTIKLVISQTKNATANVTQMLSISNAKFADNNINYSQCKIIDFNNCADAPLMQSHNCVTFRNYKNLQISNHKYIEQLYIYNSDVHISDCSNILSLDTYNCTTNIKNSYVHKLYSRNGIINLDESPIQVLHDEASFVHNGSEFVRGYKSVSYDSLEEYNAKGVRYRTRREYDEY